MLPGWFPSLWGHGQTTPGLTVTVRPVAASRGQADLGEVDLDQIGYAAKSRWGIEHVFARPLRLPWLGGVGRADARRLRAHVGGSAKRARMTSSTRPELRL